jgi:hypothetical protein
MITIATRIRWLLLEVASGCGISLVDINDRIGDYRTIDWVHDSVKDQFRKKKLRSMTGLRGIVVNLLDSSEGWVLVGLIGIPLKVC